MAGEDKPYRVYKSGRGGRRLPRFSLPGKRAGPLGKPPGPPKALRQPKSTRRRVLQALGILFCLFVAWLAAWILASYFSFQDGVDAANKRLPPAAKRALTKQSGLLFDASTTILLLGTDHADIASRASSNRSDSIMLMRTDPGDQRIYYLSIPRDLYVPIPGFGSNRINAAYQFGGPALTIRTVESLTGLRINHIAIVDFNQFKKVIDELGGVTINVPEAIHSNRFDCPYSAAKCQTWTGWRFGKGPQHMDGERALVYSRIRENKLAPGENDLTRAERQQQVIQAVSSQIASVGTFLDLPFMGGDLMKPLATDLSAGQFVQLGWVKWRSGGSAIHCRLGGDPEYVNGNAVLRSSEDNRGVITMFTGASAPQPPPPGGSAYQPGCEVGSTPFPH
ncbi:MAG TPA: LCP family protein [Gaiellaceae bacterium]|nr:LCP family protein [Gaiellaceae bacterium]